LKILIKFQTNGVVVQLVRMPACHAGGRGFESRPFRKNPKIKSLGIFCFTRFCVRYFKRLDCPDYSTIGRSLVRSNGYRDPSITHYIISLSLLVNIFNQL